MFPQACVIPSVHGVGVADTPKQTSPWVDTPWADTPKADTPLTTRQTPPGNPPQQTNPPDKHPAKKMATEAGSMYPTGMHSCLDLGSFVMD